MPKITALLAAAPEQEPGGPDTAQRFVTNTKASHSSEKLAKLNSMGEEEEKRAVFILILQT